MSHPFFRVHRLAALLLLLWLTPGVRAFPPAPYYTIYGTVRDEIGDVLTAKDARVILLKGTEIVLKAPVTVGIQFDQNYELRIPIDMLRAATTLYREEAVIARSGYQIAVEFGGLRYYPVGVAGNLTAGGGSERERFDFTLGLDTDNDGLPDIWEEWQLTQCGEVPGPNGFDLSIISRNGDLDKDGVSNYDEYIQGTFACDGTSRLFLQFTQTDPNMDVMQFEGVAGRKYRLERSTNLIQWDLVPFSVGVPGFPNQTFNATEPGTVHVFVVPGPDKRVFYRLTIQ